MAGSECSPGMKKDSREGSLVSGPDWGRGVWPRRDECFIPEPGIKNGRGWGFTDCRALSVASDARSVLKIIHGHDSFSGSNAVGRD